MRKADQLYPIDVKFRSIPHAVSELGQTIPERVAFRFLENADDDQAPDTLTFGELDRRAREVAKELDVAHLVGKRALLLYPPGLDFVVGFFGAMYAGVVAVPVYLPKKNRTADRVRSIAEDAQAAAVLTHSDSHSRLDWFVDQAHGLGKIPWLATDKMVPSRHETIGFAACKPDPNQLAILQYTSGSTGKPRGVMLTQENLIQNCRVIQKAFQGKPDDVTASWLPTYHDMGLVGGILTPAATASTVVLMSPMAFLQRPIRWFRMITKYGITISGAPNFAYELCTHKITDEELEGIDLSSWQLAFNGAEPIRAATLREFTRRFAAVGFGPSTFYACFGMAESTLLVTGTRRGAAIEVRRLDRDALERDFTARSSGDESTGTMEVVSSGTVQDQAGDVRIVDPHLGRECESGRVGEIWISSASVGAGYWNRPEETREVFQATLAGEPGRWYLRSGDLGFVDGGELYVVGRIKDMIIVRGVNHYPQDIEQTTERADRRVRLGATAAFGIVADGEERLVIVSEVRRTTEESLPELDALIGSIRRDVSRMHDLPPYAIVLIRNGSIPKTSSGKIRRNDCREAYLNGSLLELHRWVASPARLTSEITTLGSESQVLEAVYAEVRRVAQTRYEPESFHESS